MYSQNVLTLHISSKNEKKKKNDDVDSVENNVLSFLYNGLNDVL